jgi:hypothetical protein
MIRACFFGSEIWGSLLALDVWNATNETRAEKVGGKKVVWLE